jgi:phosphohistidine phosphatase
MIVYFIRHGIAEEAEAWRGSDAERPLTEKGRGRMSIIAACLADLGIEPDAILTSPLVRARQTAEIIAKRLRGKAEDDERLAGGFDLERLGAILEERAGADSLMLVGHEPTMSAVIGHAVGDADVEMKKGAVACVEFSDSASPRGRLLWLVPPKILAG